MVFSNPIIDITKKIKQEAYKLGFDACGISQVTFLEKETIHFKSYLNKGYHGKMQYLVNNFDKRLDPRKLVPNSKSIISLLLNYYPSEIQNPDSNYKVSKYAYGKDYHMVLKNKMKELVNFIESNSGKINSRCFVDSGPVLDKAWAAKAGLGWIGKNTLLINENIGSFTFIGDIILDIELKFDKSIEDKCGTCTKCMDECPVQALVAPYKLNASKCISYQTTSSYYDSTTDSKSDPNNWIWGCDICQDVCPWNSNILPNKEKDFKINKIIRNYSTKDWYQISEDILTLSFSNSAIKKDKLKNNIKACTDTT